MDSTRLGTSELTSSRLVYGCMRISGENSAADREKGKAAIRAAIEAGYTHFDHADIYAGGASESVFGDVLREDPALRTQLLITSKCGIRIENEPAAGFPKRYDFSQGHIVNSVDGSLARLGVEYLDLLLLHRPDFLCDTAEVAETFRHLKKQGKVRYFGVSNFRPSQFTMLQKFCDDDLLVNQVEVNIDNLSALDDGTLDQCQELDVTPMAWCPLGGVAYPAWGGNLSQDRSKRVMDELKRQGEKYSAEPWIVVLSWLLMHPAGICPIIGSTRPSRIGAATESLKIQYSREDWYRLLEARNGDAVP